MARRTLTAPAVLRMFDRPVVSTDDLLRAARRAGYAADIIAIRNALSRLRTAGKIERVGRKRYGLLKGPPHPTP